MAVRADGAKKRPLSAFEKNGRLTAGVGALETDVDDFSAVAFIMSCQQGGAIPNSLPPLHPQHRSHPRQLNHGDSPWKLPQEYVGGVRFDLQHPVAILSH